MLQDGTLVQGLWMGHGPRATDASHVLSGTAPDSLGTPEKISRAQASQGVTTQMWIGAEPVFKYFVDESLISPRSKDFGLRAREKNSLSHI